MKRSKRFTSREKYKKEWVTVYIEEYEPNVWNAGCCVHRSKRAQNDWYWGRKNKRSNKVELNTKKRSMYVTVILFKLFLKVLSKIKSQDTIIVYTKNSKNIKAIDRYLKRLKAYSEQTEIGWFWVLLPQ